VIDKSFPHLLQLVPPNREREREREFYLIKPANFICFLHFDLKISFKKKIILTRGSFVASSDGFSANFRTLLLAAS